ISTAVLKIASAMALLTRLSRILENALRAEVAELADALDSGSSARKGVRVQIPPSAPPALAPARGKQKPAIRQDLSPLITRMLSLLLTPKMQAPLRCENFPRLMISGKSMRAGSGSSNCNDHRSSHSGFRQSRYCRPQVNTRFSAVNERSTS